MLVLFDTSILVPALVRGLPRHTAARACLDHVTTGEVQMLISAHALAELYAVLTRMPVSPRITPEQALRLIRESILSQAEIVPLDAADYIEVIEQLASRRLAGGLIYDALHVRAAQRARVDRLWTMNSKDFIRIWPDHGGIVEAVP